MSDSFCTSDLSVDGLGHFISASRTGSECIFTMLEAGDDKVSGKSLSYARDQCIVAGVKICWHIC